MLTENVTSETTNPDVCISKMESSAHLEFSGNLGWNVVCHCNQIGWMNLFYTKSTRVSRNDSVFVKRQNSLILGT